MKRKIFVSINLSPKIQKRLARAVEDWRDLPVKWTREKNLHVTLSFLGHVQDDLLAEICDKVGKAAENFDIFEINFDLIELGPSAEDANLIWLSGMPNEDLRKLHEQIEKELGIFVADKKAFRPHITLGRIRKNRWNALMEKPEIGKEFPLAVAVESVDVMASEFEGDGLEYVVIRACPLK